MDTKQSPSLTDHGGGYDEKSPLSVAALDQQWGLEEARKIRKRMRCRRVLFGLAATMVVMAPVMMLGWHGHLHRMRWHHQGGDDSVASMADLPPGGLIPWLQLFHASGADGYDASDLPLADSRMDELSALVDSPQGVDVNNGKWHPFHGNGRVYVDPAKFQEVDVAVKAQHSWTWATASHCNPTHGNHTKREQCEIAPLSEAGDGDYVRPDDPLPPIELSVLTEEGSGNGADDDEHPDQVRIELRAFVSDKKLQHKLKVEIEEQPDQGRYLWRLTSDCKRKWWQGKGRPDKRHKDIKVLVHVHVRVPPSLPSLDALLVGIRHGAVHIARLPETQFGRLTAANFAGRVHVGYVNVVGALEVGSVSGAVVLHHAAAESVHAGNVRGLVHVGRVLARADLSVGTVAGDVYVGRSQSEALHASTVSGHLNATDITADRAVLATVSGQLHAVGTITDQLDAKSVTGPIDARFAYHPVNVPQPPAPPAPPTPPTPPSPPSPPSHFSQLWPHRLHANEEPAQLTVRSMRGAVQLHVTNEFTGRFESKSLRGAVSAEGPRVHITTDKSHYLSGYVGDEDPGQGSPLAVAKTFTGAAKLFFDH